MPRNEMVPRGWIVATLGVAWWVAPIVADAQALKRTASGRPDLTGTYDVSTLTPLQRPEEFGQTLELTVAEANKIMEDERQRTLVRDLNRGPTTSAPPAGGAPPVGFDDDARETSGAGNVGGYNNFWVDRGTAVFSVDGKFRTSIIVEPKNGRLPAMTEDGLQRMSARRALFRPNDGTAWWLTVEGPGPYDGPESLAIAERCLLGFTGVAPTFPSLYNNYKRIVQTDDHVMILLEMVHDARIVRMNAERAAGGPHRWLGDAVGRWEGDTLVVDTQNFHPQSQMRGGSAATHVVERFTLQPDGNVHYRFTVEDDDTWTAPWTGEYIWRRSDERVYEYACHEGNYAMGNILRGARLLEAEAKAKKAGSE